MKSCRLSILLPVSALTVCILASSVDAQRHSFRVHQENAVPVAETTGGPQYEGELFAFEPIVTLNQDEANPESLLYYISEMTVDAEGNVYVVDNRSFRVAVFGSDGNYRHAIGRRGSGPGEFQQIDIVWFDDEVLTLWDSSNRRMSRFRCDGTFLDDRAPPHQVQVSKMMTLPDERLLTWHTSTDVREGYAWSQVTARVLTASGDTLAGIVSDEIVTGAGEQRSPIPGIVESVITTIPFTSNPAVLYDSERGLAVTTGMTPEVLWYDLEGNLNRIYRLPLEVSRVTPAVKRSYRDYLQQRALEMAERTGRDPRPIQEPTYPEHVALWYGGFLDDAGYLWLDALDLPGYVESPDGNLHFVLDPDGRWLGCTSLPGSRITIRHGKLVSMHQDPESRENIITVYRVRSLIDGLEYPDAGH